MNTATKKPEPIRHSMTIEVAIDPLFIEVLTKYNDVFRMDTSGCWAFGVPVHIPGARSETGWLVYDRGDDANPTTEECDAAVLALTEHSPLPARWYLLDRAAAFRAWEHGVRRWGTGWYDHVDGPRTDVLVQLALLGEVRYG